MTQEESTFDADAQADDEFLLRFLPGDSPAIRRLRAAIALLNHRTNQRLFNAVLITGETGVGKGRTARLLAGHRRWKNNRGTESDLGVMASIRQFMDRFREIPLMGVPETLAESRLFGHTKGAFTDAKENTPGLLDGDLDDILLDEIGDAPLTLQAKLLDTVQYQRFMPVGANEYKDTDARFIFATWRDLPAMMTADPPTFREDLYFRITTWALEVPPLREQRENIHAIARELLTVATRKIHGPDATEHLATLSLPPDDDFEWARTQHDWPGNIRELEHDLWQWIAYQGGRSFSEIVKSNADRYRKGDGLESQELAEAVSRKLDAVREGRVAKLSSPKDFVDDCADEIKRAFAAYCERHGITPKRRGDLVSEDCTDSNFGQAVNRFKTAGAK